MRQTWPDIPGVAVWPWPAHGGIEVRIEDETGEAADAARVEAEWRRLCADNPRLFDGPVLSVLSLDPGRQIRVRRASYKHLAVQPAVETGVEQLSVTGIVLMEDQSGIERVFLGRRSRETGVYGGMWELGPSGGVDPPPQDTVKLTERDLVAQLLREFWEETGAGSPVGEVRLRAVCQDLVAHSYDVVFTCRATSLSSSEESKPDLWEYDRVRWVPLGDIGALDAELGSQIIAPTRALFRLLGWV